MHHISMMEIIISSLASDYCVLLSMYTYKTGISRARFVLFIGRAYIVYVSACVTEHFER